MEQLKNEQTEVVTEVVTQEEQPRSEATEVSLGKFKDINSLLSAYNSLQAEFTKRCQRIKELEAATEKTDKTIVPETKSAEKGTDNLSDTTLKEEILKDYLKEIMSSQQKAVVMDGAGVGIKTPVKRPTTIEQAGNLFKEILANK